MPRSGSFAISASGRHVSAPAIARSVQAGVPRFSPKNFASTSATPTLANSDGCRLNAAETNPSPRAHLDRAEEQDVHQHAEQADVDEVRLVGERPVVEREHDTIAPSTDDDGVQLRDVQLRVAARRVGAWCCRSSPRRARTAPVSRAAAPSRCGSTAFVRTFLLSVTPAPALARRRPHDRVTPDRDLSAASMALAVAQRIRRCRRRSVERAVERRRQRTALPSSQKTSR